MTDPTRVLFNGRMVLREHFDLATRDARLGVGHIWTEVSCPAYRTLNPADCICQEESSD